MINFRDICRFWLFLLGEDLEGVEVGSYDVIGEDGC